MTEPTIHVMGITKSFRTTRALAGVDFTAEKGALLALLGPHGPVVPLDRSEHRRRALQVRGFRGL